MRSIAIRGAARDGACSIAEGWVGPNASTSCSGVWAATGKDLTRGLNAIAAAQIPSTPPIRPAGDSRQPGRRTTKAKRANTCPHSVTPMASIQSRLDGASKMPSKETRNMSRPNARRVRPKDNRRGKLAWLTPLPFIFPKPLRKGGSGGSVGFGGNCSSNLMKHNLADQHFRVHIVPGMIGVIQLGGRLRSRGR